MGVEQYFLIHNRLGIRGRAPAWCLRARRSRGTGRAEFCSAVYCVDNPERDRHALSITNDPEFGGPSYAFDLGCVPVASGHEVTACQMQATLARIASRNA